MGDLLESFHPRFLEKEIIDLSFSQNLPIKRRCCSFEIFYHDAFQFVHK